jgi:hypothetical protein
VFAAPPGFVLYLPKQFPECGIQPRFRVLGFHQRFQAELLEANYRPCGHDEMGQLMQKVLAQIGRALMDLSNLPPGFSVIAAVRFCPRQVLLRPSQFPFPGR